ncbi:1-deoxy-D-xylulose-5-phosphate reductoisomerase [Paenibacillus sp. 32O-W]|uniref:1-deoxy-D-xylulose-5-phosphate reductoisomerase n=1 Tax=Paenibacillus sp. 32O-W TaxID=1695218 RepID=UPI0011A4B31A|nr:MULTISPECIES: 1-deoxy-D-xylulose-5-phosphate reductoisomerase [Paenibacillaceae]
MKKISILGSTGSVGTQTLDVIAHDPDSYRVEGLAAGTNLPLLIEQVRQFKPSKVSVATKELAAQLKPHVPSTTAVFYGEEGMMEVAAGTEADLVVTAVVGSQGLKPTLAAIEAGKQIAIANKETLVSAGHLVTELAAKHGVALLPVDSEHSAIFQCLNGESPSTISKLTLTASGGAFRDRTREELHGVTLEDALKHPNWSMGAKITIDSATMANKGLEVIEAHWLFQVSYDQIEVILHQESTIHSMVEFADYSVIAQLGNPDMRVPIQYALTYPNRKKTPTAPLRLAELGKLHFKPMDMERFPCLAMAYESGRMGGTAPAVFNAANEIAVSRFMKGEITFLQIEEIIERVLDKHQLILSPDLDQVLQTDEWARETAARIVF